MTQDHAIRAQSTQIHILHIIFEDNCQVWPTIKLTLESQIKHTNWKPNEKPHERVERGGDRVRRSWILPLCKSLRISPERIKMTVFVVVACRNVSKIMRNCDLLVLPLYFCFVLALQFGIYWLWFVFCLSHIQPFSNDLYSSDFVRMLQKMYLHFSLWIRVWPSC